MIIISALIIIISLSTAYSASPYFYDYDEYIRFHWKGAIQPTSIHFKIFPQIDNIGSLNTFIVTYTKPVDVPVLETSSLSTVITFTPHAHPVSELNMTGLTPKTQYYYTFVMTEDATIDPDIFLTSYSSSVTNEFAFRTFDVALTPYSFRFGAASCSETLSNSTVFQNVTAENFDFFIHMGDLHYEDIWQNNETLFYEAHYKMWTSPNKKKFLQEVPIYYNWDDHDFGPNDADGNSPTKPAVTTVYKRFAPIPESTLKNYLPAGVVIPNDGSYLSYNTDEWGIFRSFVVGRCLFIQLDLRTWNEVIPGDLMGAEQRTWFENQIRYAGRTPEIKMVFIISSVPWISQDPEAMWGDFGITQEWIGTLVEDYIYANQKKIMLVAGDAHMLGFDDGRNNNRGRFPVVQAAALDRKQSCKGGPYSHGMKPGTGQYGSIEVIDDGSDQICVNIELKHRGVNVISYNTCHPENYPPSDKNRCPSKVQIIVAQVVESVKTTTAAATDSGAIYIIIFGNLLVIGLICSAIFWYRRVNLKKKTALLKKQAEELKLKEEGQSVQEPVKPRSPSLLPSLDHSVQEPMKMETPRPLPSVEHDHKTENKDIIDWKKND